MEKTVPLPVCHRSRHPSKMHSRLLYLSLLLMRRLPFGKPVEDKGRDPLTSRRVHIG